ncbi:sulfatase family protein [Streptomyces physcomitrii]|uniref:Sulfatase n=1 Tax=Streptomyces physcomitrii TaxID=2724184 RepID=A0ABX1GYL8_9ACTN|nr:sulfatase [Streptomyces physcomitrii]NKI40882.1 sulfatase [Streptomyces physcomitrii]
MYRRRTRPRGRRAPGRAPGRTGVWLALGALLLAGATACGDGGSGKAAEESAAPSAPPSADSGEADSQRNIVFVLTDDLSEDLVEYMPHVEEMRKQGLSFADYTVTDSLCCPSRSSIYTGKYPHNTGVFTNTPPDGGFDVFHEKGNEDHTFATSLKERGYRTAMMGKYLNRYEPDMTVGGEKNYVPPGWDEWAVAGNGYPEYDYTLNENGRTVKYGHEPEDYLTDVVSRKGQDFVTESAKDGKPFVLDISTFAPHGPATPAPEDEEKFASLKAPRPPSFDKLPEDAPKWLAQKKPLPEKQLKKIDRNHRERVRSVQAVDRMIGDLQDRLKKEGVYEDTVFVFASDNGFHMGEYRLTPGKQTAFDTDVNVPLIVTGPGVPEGRTSHAVVGNIDLAPTFTALGGGTPASEVDGRSLVPLLGGETPKDWPRAALIEHHGAKDTAEDPDRPRKGSGNPPGYEAIRTADATYVEYADGSREFYDRRRDPDQLHNTYGELSGERKKELARQVAALRSCEGAKECGGAAGS